MDRERLQERRAQHSNKPDTYGDPFCSLCYADAPCEDSQILDLALAHFHEEYPYDCECFNSGQTQAEEYAKRIGTLEAERLRAENEALKVCQCESCDESLEGEAYCVKCFERLRADLERLARATMGITAAGAKAYGEAAWLRTNMNAIDALKASKNYPDDILKAVWLISDSALAGTEHEGYCKALKTKVESDCSCTLAGMEANVDRLTEVIEREGWEDTKR